MIIRKYSRQREAIKTHLMSRCDHPTADQIYSSLRESYPNLSLGTVYRNLSLLTEIGEVARISTGLGPERYDGTVRPHQHFICRCCTQVFDIELDDMAPLLKSAEVHCPGRIESYTAHFYGTCTSCSESST